MFSFLESVVDGRRASDDDPSCRKVAETMNLLGKNFNGYQIMDWSKHTMTKYLADQKKTSKLATTGTLGDSIL